MPNNLPFPSNLLHTIQNQHPTLFVEMQFVYLAQNARSSRDAKWIQTKLSTFEKIDHENCHSNATYPVLDCFQNA
jgi:hypothetical protein